MRRLERAHARRALCAAICALWLAPIAAADDTVAPGSGWPSGSGYVGSAACRSCHSEIHDAWARTRHAYSVLSAEEAQAAGYPLPDREVETDPVRGWPDFSYVIGGRQRIAYADRAGRVQDIAYHHRVGGFSPFPTKPMAACGPCHLTGFGEGASHEEDPALPGPFIERNITCEECHGPGAAHAESQEARDIVVDASSRACGNCHTSAGKVLPKDDLHDTHDLVQTWNRDPHVLGVRFHSHNAFCSDCHAPYERGAFTDREEGAAKRVFSESKQNITCIGCHDPHGSTDATYQRDAAYLGPPIAPRRAVYRGNDDDFTTADFDRFASTEQVCLDCHTGADRIDLDHANATCNDCHNTFNRNRQPESRAFHDANQRRLSCRPCHHDADHLISIVYRDRDFLEPRHLHNLRTLPRAVIERYGFRYPKSRPKHWAALPADPGGLSVPDELSAAALSARHTARERPGSEPPPTLRDGTRHEALGADDDALRALEAARENDPSSLSAHLALAVGHASRENYAAAREVLELAANGDSAVYRSLLFGAGSAKRTLPPDERSWELPDPDPQDSAATATVLWLQSLIAMGEGQFDAAARGFARARAIEPTHAGLAIHLGLALLGERHTYRAAETLEAAIEEQPGSIAPRIALAAIYINTRRLALAEDHLEAARAVDPDHAVAAYFRGRAALRQRKPEEAAAAFRTALVAEPEDLNAWFHLARAYRAAGSYGAAIDAYQEIIRTQPRLFDARSDLARLYKLMSDKVNLTHMRESEKTRPVGVSAHEWERYLSQLENRAAEYGELALRGFDAANDIRPLDADGVRQIGEILRRSGRFVEARERFELLARSQPTEWLHRYRLGTIAIRQEEYADAIAHLEGALALAPTEGDIYGALALAHARSGHTDEAIATLQRGAVYEPFNPALYTNLGAAYAARGEYAHARESLERAVRLRTFPLPRTHLAYTNLGIVHWREGRRAEAVQALQKALHSFSDYVPASRLLARMTTPDDLRESETVLVYDDLLERFGETSTIQFAEE